jgi:hypothetical protein
MTFITASFLQKKKLNFPLIPFCSLIIFINQTGQLIIHYKKKSFPEPATKDNRKNTPCINKQKASSLDEILPDITHQKSEKECI